MKKDGKPGQYIDLDKNTRVLSETRNGTTVEKVYRKVNEVDGISRGGQGQALGAAVGAGLPGSGRGACREQAEDEDEDEKTSRVVPNDRVQDIGYLPGKVLLETDLPVNGYPRG